MDLTRRAFLLEERARAQRSLAELNGAGAGLRSVIATIDTMLARLSDTKRPFPVDVEVRYEHWIKDRMKR